MPEIAGDEMHIRPRAFQYFFRASDFPSASRSETDQHSFFPTFPLSHPACPRAAERRVYDNNRPAQVTASRAFPVKRTGTCPAPTKAGGCPDDFHRVGRKIVKRSRAHDVENLPATLCYQSLIRERQSELRGHFVRISRSWLCRTSRPWRPRPRRGRNACKDDART